MLFRHLIVSAVCAALLGLAASRLLGPSLIEMAGEASPYRAAPAESPTDDNSQPVTLADTEVAEPAVAAPVKRRSSRRARSARITVPDSFGDDLSRGITKLGERRYEIKRSAWDLAMANLGALPRFAHVTAELHDGQPSGFRLSGIQGDGPFSKLGLRSGDVLISVNGLDITTPDRVLDAYGKLKASTHLALGFLRGNERILQEYAIR